MLPGRHKPVEERAFLAKFKRKRTSDDCFTPENVYEAVAGWVEKRYGVRRADFVRPFWPDSDFETFDYSAPGCVVVDNPPFSIVSKIVRWYLGRGVRFFLFAPYLTNIGIVGGDLRCSHVIAPWSVRFENGAEVPLSFVTNLDPELVAESAPDLRQLIREADEKNRAATKRSIPKYSFPPEVLTSAALGYMADHGTPFRVRRGDCAFVRALDAGVQIFGGGLLLSPRAAAERAAAERAAAERAAARRFALSERETALSRSLGEQPISKSSTK